MERAKEWNDLRPGIRRESHSHGIPGGHEADFRRCCSEHSLLRSSIQSHPNRFRYSLESQTGDTIREQLPDGFQRAEYLHKHGMVDMVVHRHDLKDTLSTLLDYLAPAEAA